MRRQFPLPEEDHEFLESLEYEWETINEGSHKWLLIHKYPIPEGFDYEKVSISLRIDSGYPTSQIDMAYFYPPIHRNDGKPIGALANQKLDGKIWQRWSRHRTKTNPWRPGVDNVSTHMALILTWLEREFKIR